MQWTTDLWRGWSPMAITYCTGQRRAQCSVRLWSVASVRPNPTQGRRGRRSVNNLCCSVSWRKVLTAREKKDITFDLSISNITHQLHNSTDLHNQRINRYHDKLSLITKSVTTWSSQKERGKLWVMHVSQWTNKCWPITITVLQLHMAQSALNLWLNQVLLCNFGNIQCLSELCKVSLVRTRPEIYLDNTCKHQVPETNIKSHSMTYTGSHLFPKTEKQQNVSFF